MCEAVEKVDSGSQTNTIWRFGLQLLVSKSEKGSDAGVGEQTTKPVVLRSNKGNRVLLRECFHLRSASQSELKFKDFRPSPVDLLG
mmetsp:Transcript_6661/g.13531  ORF Transcript_6661/g.13531 Transcript_6661/m.13531 type:complete len:86 (+) Transcript_6661:1176-1433(+)